MNECQILLIVTTFSHLTHNSNTFTIMFTMYESISYLNLYFITKAPEGDGRLFASQHHDLKKHDKNSKTNDHRHMSNGESKNFGVSRISKGSFNRTDEFHSNGLGHGNKYSAKSICKMTSSADEGEEAVVVRIVYLIAVLRYGLEK